MAAPPPLMRVDARQVVLVDARDGQQVDHHRGNQLHAFTR
jgi:hypothetical protein